MVVAVRDVSEVREGKGPGMQILNTGKLRIVLATFIGGMAVACNAGGTSESDAQALQSRLRKADSECICTPKSAKDKRCDPKLSELEQSSENDESVAADQVKEWGSYTRDERVKVKSADLAEFKKVFGDEMVCTQSSVKINPRGPRAQDSGEKSWQNTSSLSKCSSIARQAVWSQSFANASANFCLEDKTLTSTDPKAPWYGKSAAGIESFRIKLIQQSGTGAKSKGNVYACQCQKEEGCILFRPDPLAKGQSMFMDEYGAFFFENHQQLGTWGFCKKHL